MTSFKELTDGMTLPAPSRSDPLLVAAIEESMSLATYIPKELKDGVKEALLSSIAKEKREPLRLHEYIEQHLKVEVHTASKLALDLTRKLYSNYSKQKMLRLGLKKFKWLHTGGGNNAFHEHIAMSDQIYRFDDPPIINSKTGQRGFPSDLPGCRCKIITVIEFSD